MSTSTAEPTTVRSAPDEAGLPAALPDPGTILGIWAHPDDEAYLSAGLVLHARAAGRRVVVVTATDGGLGGPGRTALARRRLAATRRRELAASLRVLGVEEHHRLGYPDGGCAAADPDAAADRLAEVVRDVRPDTIVSFGPDGLTGHRDHRVVGSWAVRAAALAGHTGRVWFPTLTPQFHERWSVLNERAGLWMDAARVPSTPADQVAATVRLTGDHLDRKVAALAAQASQTAGLIDLVGRETYARWWSTEWFREALPAERAAAAADAGGDRHVRA